MEYLPVWNLANISQSFIIVHPQILTDLSSTNYAFIENELILSTDYSKSLYSVCLENIKSFSPPLTQDMQIYLDLSVLINAELCLAWNLKIKNLSVLNISQQVHINTLSVKLHRKAAVAWEFRKILVSLERPQSELSTLLTMQELHKQNYYLWEYKRWFFLKILSKIEQEIEYSNSIEYCSVHITDSSAFHYLGFISSHLGLNDRTYDWVCKLCDRFYGKTGFYSEKLPVGFETLCLLRAKTRNSLEKDLIFSEEQLSMGRKISYLYIKT